MLSNRAWRGRSTRHDLGASIAAIGLLTTSCVPGASGSPASAHHGPFHAVCNNGAYVHIPGDFPEYGPPQTLYVGSTPDGIGSVFRVQASGTAVALFYANGAGQLNYVFQLLGDSLDPAQFLWREQSDFNCRGTMTVETDPANFEYAIYSAEPAGAAFAFPSSSP